MIISASRRTDVPAFHARWFLDRLRAAFCSVANPFNPRQVARVSLKPEDVDVVVFWTKYPRPLLSHLPELDDRGYRYYFQFTVNGYPRLLERHVPSLDRVVDVFARLADRVGPRRVIWRYDPIILSDVTGENYHLRSFEGIATQLEGKSGRVMLSVVDTYRKTARRLRALEGCGLRVEEAPDAERVRALLAELGIIARARSFTPFTCAEPLDLVSVGVARGKCIDDAYIRETFGTVVSGEKDRSQRRDCGCVRSVDIGAYNTCLYGCQYCYAVSANTP